jgi:hypothetical protein
VFKLLSSAFIAACFATSTIAATVTGGSGILTGASANQLETWLGQGAIGLTSIFSKSVGSTSTDFHAAVDGNGQTFSVIELDNGNVIGGFNPYSWSSSSSYTRANNSDAFLFNLTTGVKYDRNRFNYVAYNYIYNGPTFGGGHDLYINSSLSGGYANIGHTYGDSSQLYKSAYRNAFSGSYNAWTVTKLDVFTVGPAISTVPLPAGSLLLLTALAGVAGLKRRKKLAA